MKSINIVKKLQKEGYNIVYKKWGYWDSIPHVQLEGFEFAIAQKKYNGNWQSCCVDFIYNHVLDALDLAKTYNPIILKKMNDGYWDYSIYLINSMEDYYFYKKRVYPFDEYYHVMGKLENEVE